MVRVGFDIAVYDQEAAAGEEEAAAGAADKAVVKSRQQDMPGTDQQNVRVVVRKGPLQYLYPM